MLLLEPFVQMLYLSENKRIVDCVLEEIIEKVVLDVKGILQLIELHADGLVETVLSKMIDLEDLAVLLYKIPYADETLSKNKTILKNFCKKWSKKVNIPFLEKVVVTGMKIEEKEVPVDLDRVVDIAKKQKRKQSTDDWVMVETEDAIEAVGSPKAKKVKESVESPKKDYALKEKASKEIKEIKKKEMSPKKESKPQKKAHLEDDITKEIEFDVESKKSKKSSFKSPLKEEVLESPKLVVTNDLTIESKTSPKKIAKLVKVDPAEEDATVAEEKDQINQRSLTNSQKKKAKKLRKAKSLPEISSETTTEIESPTDPAEKKSVSWGPKHIKRISN